MLTVELAGVEFPAWTPAGQRDMFSNRQLRRQGQNLNLTRYAVVEQDFRVAAAGKITEMNLQVRSPAVGRRS